MWQKPQSDTLSCLECREKQKKYSKISHTRDGRQAQAKQKRDERKVKGLCSNCVKNFAMLGKTKCFDCATNLKEYNQKLKDKAYEMYGGYKCNCCGETIKQFLTLDHINNDGSKHRKKTGKNFYIWLRDNNYPPIIQVLCYNCNCGKARNNGICPYKETIKVTSICCS